jgi:DNA-binding XRE family transcriptional regulator
MDIDKKFKAKFDKEVGPLSFALFMRVARNSMDLTQEAMGKKLGISRANICDIEKGRHLVSTEFAIKVAKKAKLSEKLALMACLQDQVRKAGSKVVVSVA